MKELNLKLITKKVKIRLPYILYVWNHKRSGHELYWAFNNGTMSGIVIRIKSNYPHEVLKL